MHQQPMHCSYYSREQLETLLYEVNLSDFVLDLGTIEMVNLPLIRDFTYQSSEVALVRNHNGR